MYGDKDARNIRDAIIFDEKPSGVFNEFSITIRSGSIDAVDQLIELVPKEEKTTLAARSKEIEALGLEAQKSLLEILLETRKYLLDRLSGASPRIKQLKGLPKSDAYSCLSQINPLSRLGSQTLVYKLQGLASKQETKKKQHEVQKLASLCESLISYDGPIIETYTVEKNNVSHSLTYTWGGPRWAELRKNWPEKFIVMDATAHLDPDYSLPGAPDLIRIPQNQTFPNFTIHCTSPKDVSASKFIENWDSKYEAELKNLIQKISEEFPGEEILIVTKKGEQGSIKKKVVAAVKDWPHVYADHFGNLKGSNDYRRCKHIIFTNFLQWRLDSYLLRALYLSEPNERVLTQRFTANMGKNGIMKNKGKFSQGAEFRNQGLEMLRLQYEAPDMIQTIMRTALRDDTNAKVHVWLPGQNPRKIGMLLDYFVGARVQTFGKSAPP